MRKESTTDTTPRVQAITSGSIHVKGKDYDFRLGQVFRADEPPVLAAPLYFLPFDATSEQVRAAQDAIGHYRV